MKRGRILSNVVILVIAFGMAGVTCAATMGTAFTYQGRLTDANSPAEGWYNFGFMLYDDPNEAAEYEVAPGILQELEVIDGYFTTRLDFEVEYTGQAYWLGIGLWDGSDPNTVVMLSPRQEVTPTPYSNYAASSNWNNIYDIPLDFADGVDDVGLSVETDPTVPTNLKDGVSWGEVSDIPAGFADGVDDIGGADSDWTINGSDMYSGVAGKVGIGTDSPLSKLSVGGIGMADAGVGGEGTAYGVYGYGSDSLGVGAYGIGTYAGVVGRDADSGSFGQLGYDTYGGFFVGDGYFSGDVGIGTAIPGAKLEVVGTVNATAFTGDGSGLTGIADSDWTINGTDMYTNAGVTGNVGIGTTSPTAKLHIGGTAGVDGIKFPDDTIQTTSAAALEALIASLEARIAELEPQPGWGTAEMIETDNLGHAVVTQVAFDASGNAVAVWTQDSGGLYVIWSNRYVVATGLWSFPELIETNLVGHAANPQIAVDGSGNAIVVWRQHDGTRDNIWSNRYVAGTGWGIAELIETVNLGNAENPQVAVDPNGNAVAVWWQDDGTRWNIWSNRYVAGTGWGTAELIETENLGNAASPQVAVDSSGNAVAVWAQDDGTRWNIWSNRYVEATGLWGTAEMIETDNLGDAASPQVAVDSSGNAVAVWWQDDGTRDNIWSNRYVAGTGLWGTAEMIETDNAGSAWLSQVAVDPSGNAVAVWWQHDGTRYNIYSNRYVSGSSWGTAELIETDNLGNAGNPQVGVNSSGNAVAVWEQSDGTRDSIYSNRYVTGTGLWGTAELIETISGDADYPQVAIDGSGNVIAVWHHFDGIRDNIWSNRYVNE